MQVVYGKVFDMKFKGILLASDWDRTLFSDGKVSIDNQKAIKYFQSEGGLFTVCSGRSWQFIDGFKDVIKPNTYAITYNGGCIYHLDKHKLLCEGFCDDNLISILKEFCKMARGEISLVFHIKNREATTISKNEFLSNKTVFSTTNIYKCVVVSDCEVNGTYNSEIAKALNLYDYIAVRSWPTGLEFFKETSSKGVALKKVAEAEGVKLTVAVGDYENDISMLKAADIGYAVDNAIESVKLAADRITVSCKDSALAKIIYDLEKSIDAKELII